MSPLCGRARNGPVWLLWAVCPGPPHTVAFGLSRVTPAESAPEPPWGVGMSPRFTGAVSAVTHQPVEGQTMGGGGGLGAAGAILCGRAVSGRAVVTALYSG